jgi:anthranilate synthase component I
MDGDDFLNSWRHGLTGGHTEQTIPGIRCLFYAAYEAVTLVENLPKPKAPVTGPILWTHFPAWSICIDGEAGMLHMSTLLDETHLDTLQAMIEDSATANEAPALVSIGDMQATPPQDYLQTVERVKAYIRAGDVFQANIARFWRGLLAEGCLGDLYASLRQVNPAPFSCLVRIGDTDPFYVISASPERLFRLSPDGHVDTRPIAGTRRRGDGVRDVALASELMLSEKERAEHVMLVDLERNDLGRVCVPGSVEVDECMGLERYATVQHIVSNVRGCLTPDRDVVDVFRAMFPGGTITGCPKLRCMEIIHELEPRPRGAYTGGVGYVGWDGSADMNILIRSFWWHHGLLEWAAGAGIVADSEADAELRETWHKAEGLLRAFRRRSVHDDEQTGVASGHGSP